MGRPGGSGDQRAPACSAGRSRKVGPVCLRCGEACMRACALCCCAPCCDACAATRPGPDDLLPVQISCITACCCTSEDGCPKRAMMT